MNHTQLPEKNRSARIRKILLILAIVLLVAIVILCGITNISSEQEHITRKFILYLIAMLLLITFFVIIEFLSAIKLRAALYDVPDLEKSNVLAKWKKLIFLRRFTMTMQIVMLAAEAVLSLSYAAYAQQGNIDKMMLLGDVEFILSCAFYASTIATSILSAKIEKFFIPNR